jgi:hypothetical protein
MLRSVDVIQWNVRGMGLISVGESLEHLHDKCFNNFLSTAGVCVFLAMYCTEPVQLTFPA